MGRLIDHLRSLGMSNRDAKRALQTGKVYVRDAPVADPTRDVDAALVRVRDNAPRVRVGADIVIVHRDDHLAVVFKPPGMLSVPAPGRRDARTVVGEATRALGGALPVHRLDEPTSGLMLVARTERCQLALKDLLFRHDVERAYLALVRGRFPTEPTAVRNVLVRDRGDGRRGSGSPSTPNGKPAATVFRLVAPVGRNASLVEARLETGRTHQVRIHLAELGYPVLGDPLYGEGVARAAPRLALHARLLGFRHPFGAGELRFETELPDDLERLRRDLA
jgi:RluA family pseudouridine synthase